MTIAGLLTTVGELDSELSGLQSALGDLRTSYLSELASATADPAPFQRIGVQMKAKVTEIKRMYDLIQSYFDHQQQNLGAIEQSWYAGERYTP